MKNLAIILGSDLFIHETLFLLSTTPINVVGGYNPNSDENKNSALNQITLLELTSKAQLFFIDANCFMQFYSIFETYVKLGKDIWINGPISLDLNSLRKMEGLLFESRSKLQFYNCLINKPLCVEAAKCIQKPRLIKFKKHTVNPLPGEFDQWLLTNALPEIQAIVHLSGTKIRSLIARPLYLNKSIPEVISIHIEFENDAICQITLGSAIEKNMNKATFFQSNKIIQLNFKENTILEQISLNNEAQLFIDENEATNSLEKLDFIQRTIPIFNSFEKEINAYFDLKKVDQINPVGIENCQTLQQIQDMISDKLYRKYAEVI